MLGAAYTAMNSSRNPSNAMKRHLNWSPNDPLLYMGIGSNYYRLGEFDKAIQAMEKAIGLDPSFGEAKSLLGDFYLASCNLDDARRLFDDVIRNENNSMFARNMAQLGLADIFVAEKNPVSAHELLDKIPENDSIIVGSKYCALARMLEQQNNIDLARRYYLRAAFSTKQMVGAYADLGVMLVKNGENQEGYQYLQKVKILIP